MNYYLIKKLAEFDDLDFIGMLMYVENLKHNNHERSKMYLYNNLYVEIKNI